MAQLKAAHLAALADANARAPKGPGGPYPGPPGSYAPGNYAPHYRSCTLFPVFKEIQPEALTLIRKKKEKKG